MSESTKTNAERFKVLGGDTRLAIIEHLRDGPKNVGELAETLGISQPSVSQSLRLLKTAGLVQGQKNGNWVNYSHKFEGSKESRTSTSAWRTKRRSSNTTPINILRLSCARRCAS